MQKEQKTRKMGYGLIKSGYKIKSLFRSYNKLVNDKFDFFFSSFPPFWYWIELSLGIFVRIGYRKSSVTFKGRNLDNYFENWCLATFHCA